MRQRYQDIPDEELARRVRRGDEGSFEELVTRHQSAVRRWVRWIDRRPERVDDLSQEVFLKAWLARKKFRGESSWRTWVMRIALRVCLDQKRRYEPATEPLTERSLPDHLLLPDTPGMERVMMDRSRIASLRKVMDDLPPKSRAVIVLRYMEEYNSTEIGEIIGRPPGTVRRLLFEARQALREAIQLEEESGGHKKKVLSHES